MKIWQPYKVKRAKFPKFSRRTLHNKPILFVPKRVKTHLRQCRIQKISGGGPPDPPLQGEGEGGREKWKRGGDEEGERRGGEGGEVGREGWKERA
jgi:hypothetical protein